MNNLNSLATVGCKVVFIKRLVNISFRLWKKLLEEFSLGLFVWQSLAFVILLFLLKKYAWKPILDAVNEREQGIRSALESAEKAKEMENLQADNEKLLKEAHMERDAMLKEARDLKNKMIEDAKDEARSLRLPN